jgi:hypothetical protein
VPCKPPDRIPGGNATDLPFKIIAGAPFHFDANQTGICTMGSALGRSIIAHGSVNLIWINALGQYSLFIFLDAEEGGLDASLKQSPPVDFQSLEGLESSLLELC